MILIRHGETHGYDGDHGLTALGEDQARRRGAALAAELGAGTVVAMPRARTARATATAEVVHKTLLAAGVAAGEPYPAAEFDNLRFALHGEIVDASVAVRARLRLAGELPHWAAEYARFDSDYGEKSKAGGPIEHWLTTPGLYFEPPQAAAYRVWAGIDALADDPAPVAVVATHSAPMRAFVVTAFGDDSAGEPENLEPIRVTLDGPTRTVTFRDREYTFPATPTSPWFPR